MSRFENTETGVVVSVDDSKDDRFRSPLWEPLGEGKPKARPKRATAEVSK